MIDKQDEQTTQDDSKEKTNNQENNDVNADKYFHSEGTQNNYFYNKEKRKIKQHVFPLDVIRDINRSYTTPDCEKNPLLILNKSRMLIVYGDNGVGKYSYARYIMSDMTIDKIISISDLDKEGFYELEWQQKTGYIIENISNDIGLEHIYCKKISNIIEKQKSFIIFTVDSDEYKKLDAELIEISMLIDLPTNKVPLVKKRVKISIENEKENHDFYEDLDILLDNQFKNSVLSNYIQKRKNVNELVRISNKISDELLINHNVLTDNDIISIINSFQKEEWYELIYKMDNIQERIYFLTIACLNGDTRERIICFNKEIEKTLYTLISKKEKRQIDNNEFGSYPWDKKIKRIKTYIDDIENKNIDKLDNLVIVIKIPNIIAERVVNYFIEQYNWYNCLIQLLYDKANECENMDQLEIISNTILYIIHNHYSNILFSLEEKCKEYKYSTNLSTLFSLLLRKIYDNTDNNNQKKEILKMIHKLLISKNEDDTILGIICYYYFTDIYLPKIIDDLILAFNNNKTLYKLISICIYETIYEQDIKAEKNDSMIYNIKNIESIWKNDNIDLINELLNLLCKKKIRKWFKKDHCYYQYPFILYLYGINKNIRHELIELILKSFNNINTREEIMELIKIIYIYVNENNDIYNLKLLYNDFIEDLKDKNAYINAMVKGIENYSYTKNIKEIKNEC